MKLCHVTPYYPHNSAICRYVEATLEGIRAHRKDKQFIVGQYPCHDHDDIVYASRPAYRPKENYVSAIADAVSEYEADIAYIQHTPDHFGHDNRLPRLCETLGERGIKTIVNCHSIYPSKKRCGYRPGRTAADFDRALAEAASCLHVHTPRMGRDLVARGVSKDKIAVIPHGSLIVEPLPQDLCRQRLDIPQDAKVAMFFGFVWLGKGLDFLLSVWRDVAKRVPNAYFYVGGYTRAQNFINHSYMKYLELKARAFGIQDRLKWYGDFVPDEEVPYLYGAADVVCLPYKQDYSSVSGVAHQAAGRSVVTLCSEIAKFDEIRDHVSPDLVCAPTDRKMWARKLTKLLVDDAYRERMRDAVDQFARDTSWENIGKMHVELHDSLLATQPKIPQTLAC